MTESEKRLLREILGVVEGWGTKEAEAIEDEIRSRLGHKGHPMTQAPDEKIVDEVARAIKDHQAGIAWGKESSCKRAAIAALAAARPLLEAEIRKDERGRMCKRMIETGWEEEDVRDWAHHEGISLPDEG